MSLVPYYADNWVTLYHGNAFDVLPRLPRQSADLLIADPPYGRHWRSGWRKTQLSLIAGDDGSFDTPTLIRLALGVLRPHRHLYVFGPADLSTLPLGTTVQLIWDKGYIGPGDLSLPWGPSHEPITFATSWPDVVTSRDQRGGVAARLRRGSVIRVDRASGGQLTDDKDSHATPKPVELLRQLVESSSVRGETVLDPCCGAGPTLEAAWLEGRKAVGVELDERNCERVARRFSQGRLDLFAELEGR